MTLRHLLRLLFPPQFTKKQHDKAMKRRMDRWYRNRGMAA